MEGRDAWGGGGGVKNWQRLLIFVIMQARVFHCMLANTYISFNKSFSEKKFHLKYTLFRYCYSSCAGTCFELIKLYCNKREKPAF